MKARAPTSRKKDKRIFTRTASKVKKINLPGTIYRGGIRL